MHVSDYGPFADVVALAGALVSMFSIFLLKMFGRLTRWTWLISGSPPFLVTAGARVLTVVLMAVIFITISKSNYGWFAGAAIVTGLLDFIAIVRFDHLRKLYVLPIPLVGPTGQQLLDKKGNPFFQNVIIGLESNMLGAAKTALKSARAELGGVSLAKFMSGYGVPINDPEALWDRALLAKISNNLTVILVCVVLLGVLTIYLAALLIEVTKA